MTATEMVDLVKSRTRQTDDTKVINELNSAMRWAFEQIFNTENGPNLLSTFDTEKTLLVYTREYDIAANVTGTFVGIKQLWLKLAGETTFSQMRSVDTTDDRFEFNDQWASADTSVFAQGHPVWYDSINFGKVRFSPPLPAGAVLRIDYFRYPPDLDPSTNDTMDYGTDLPAPTIDAICDKATAQVWSLLDDDRSVVWEMKAERRLQPVLYLLRDRVQGPTTTQPYRIRRKRYI